MDVKIKRILFDRLCKDTVESILFVRVNVCRHRNFPGSFERNFIGSVIGIIAVNYKTYDCIYVRGDINS